MSNEIPANVQVQKQHHEAMPKLGIEINSRIHVRLNPLSQTSRSMPAEFLGISHYDFIIIKLPSIPGLRNQLLPRTLIEVRYLLDGAVSSFHAEIISHVVKPAFLVFATYPNRLSIMEMRNSRRVLCALPIILNSSYGDGVGIICDLSQGGCRIAIELTGQSSLRELATNDSIVVQFTLNPEGLSIGCAATVRNTELKGSRLSAGISFDDAVKDFSDAVSNYLEMVQALLP